MENKYQDALNNLLKFEREHNIKTFGDVVPHPNSDLLQELVDKETPMKVTDIHVDEWYCPNCFQEIGTVSHYKRCPECGQKLDWSDSDAKDKR